MSVKMSRYNRQSDFMDEENSSVNSIQLNEVPDNAIINIRFHAARSSLLWKARSKAEICLFGLSVMLMIITFGLIIYIAGNDTENSTKILHVQPYTNLPCLTKECIHAASDILHAIDETIDPCDDFYGYACNQWIKNNPLPEGKAMWGSFGRLEQRNQLIIKNVLEKPESYFKSEAEKKAKLFYQSCMDEEDLMEKKGAEPLLEVLRDIGGWNVTRNLSGFDETNWSLAKTLKTVQNKYNMGGLFGWAVGEDDRNSTRHILQVDQGGLTLPTRDSYLNKTEHAKVLQAYLDFMVKVAVLLGADEEDATLQMTDVIDFETQLASITVPPEDRRDEESLYHDLQIFELQKIAPFIEWREHFEDAFQYINHFINNSDHVIVYAIDYIEKLSALVVAYNASPRGKIILNNYLVWQTVRTLSVYLSKSFRDAYKGLRKALSGADGGEDLWRYCVGDTNNVIGFAVGAMYVREVFDGDAKPEAERMINEIRAAFTGNLEHLEWMDERTRKLSYDKATVISDMIGFPDYILDPVALDLKYQDLNISATEYFENNLRVNRYNLVRNLEKLFETVNKTRWGMTPSTVNAYYTPTKNQMVFPAGILQIPFFDKNNPKSLNFGGMGVVMGHELTHAFDDQGREYDKYGNLFKWWNTRTIDKFKTLANCFVQQYNQYGTNNMTLKGLQTLGENIADNGGLKAAFHAYLNTAKQRDVDILPLPGLNMTHRQLFFVSFAQVWCAAITQETTQLQIEKDPHSPPRYRVIGPLSNLKEFSEEFQCEPGSNMNPIDKCEIW